MQHSVHSNACTEALCKPGPRSAVQNFRDRELGSLRVLSMEKGGHYEDFVGYFQ